MPRPTILQILASEFTYPAGHPEGPGPGVVYAYAINTHSGTYLVDTGIGLTNTWINENYEPSSIGFVQRLMALGIQRSEVRAVICSHLHFDHCGNNSLFPDIPIYVQRTEYEASRQDGYTVLEWLDFANADYRIISGSICLGGEIEVFHTPGHTAGHQSVLVATESGLECIVAQAAYSVKEFSGYADQKHPPVRDDCWSKVSYIQSLRMIHGRGPSRAYFSHDRAIWRSDA